MKSEIKLMLDHSRLVQSIGATRTSPNLLYSHVVPKSSSIV